MLLGYNTNGLSNHSAQAGLELLAKTGYRSVAITVDHGWLSPHHPDSPAQIQQFKHFLQSNGCSSVIETGARFLLDPTEKHSPTLLHFKKSEVQKRIDFLKYCIDVGVELESDCVSIWSGIKPSNISFNVATERLVDNLKPVLEYAELRGIDIGFEPEPGMLIDTLGRFERLLHLFDSPRLMLTLDVSHIFVSDELPLAAQLDRWKGKVATMHISDVRSGEHQHLPFGQGQIGFPLVLDAIAVVEYEGGIHIDLPDFSHQAAELIQSSHDFLLPLIKKAKEKNLEQ